MSENTELLEQSEKTGLGVLGAFLFSLIGCALWVVLYWIDIFPNFCGIIIAVLAIFGYKLFTKSKSMKSVIIPLIICAVTVLITCYICLAADVYYAYNGWFETGELSYTVPYSRAFLYAYQFFGDTGVLLAFLKEYGLGILFCLVGSALFIVDAVKYKKKLKESGAD